MKPTDITIGILSAAAYVDRREFIRKTWGRDCREVGISYRFLIGWDKLIPDQAADDILWLGCNDAYKFLPQKTRLFCQSALADPAWTWLLKTDDDSYISIPRLLTYTPPGDYTGAVWQEGITYASGAGYFLSRKAATVIADRLRVPTGIEDQLVGVYLRSRNIPLTCDNEHIIPFGTAAHRVASHNKAIICHKMLKNRPGTHQTPELDYTLYRLCHEETGLTIPEWSDEDL